MKGEYIILTDDVINIYDIHNCSRISCSLTIHKLRLITIPYPIFQTGYKIRILKLVHSVKKC